MYHFFALILFTISFLNLVILAFAFREFSYLLLVQFSLSAFGLPIATIMLTSFKEKKKMLWFTSKDQSTGRLHDVWIEENSEEYNLEGRFCINDRS